MKKTQFTEAQIVFALRQVDTGVAVAEVCRKMGISEVTYHNWKNVLKKILKPAGASTRGLPPARRLPHFDPSGVPSRVAAALELVLPTARAG